MDRNACVSPPRNASRNVALRKESVDRNDIETSRVCTDADVALRKESVDRNASKPRRVLKCDNVALRKESVDRNSADVVSVQHGCESLSARRAWIEMLWQFGRAFWPGRRSPQGERG